MNQNLNRKKKWKKWGWILGSIALLGTTTILTPLLTACSSSSQFSLGNFQAYMNPAVQKLLSKEYKGINYLYYGTNYQIPNHIHNNSVNLTIATDNMVATLAHQKLIQKIDWAKFGLLDPQTNQLIVNTNQLKSIFTPLTWMVATAYQPLFAKYLNDPNFNLLEYAVPYFLQNIVFCYRGPKIPQLNEYSSFSEIFRYISEFNTEKNTYIPGHPYNRFIKPGVYNKPQVMMVASPRTDFDIANILRQEQMQNPPADIDINPTTGLLGMPTSTTPTIQDFVNTFSYLSNYFKGFKNAIGFNTDSSTIINALALDHSKGGIMGGFIYNGDSVYTIQGGAYGSNQSDYVNINGDNIHIVMPRNNLIAMDNIIFNGSNSASINDLAYKIAYQLGLSGSDLKEWTPYNEPIGDEEKTLTPKIDALNNDGEYKYLSTANFSWVLYTPELNKIMDYAITPGPKGFFSEQGLSPELAKLSEWAIQMDSSLGLKPSYHLEMPLNDLANSNLASAFTTFMYNV